MRPRPNRISDYREYPVLYVDDEPENLRIFQLAFRREFRILTAQSGDEGLEVLNAEPVALVLSDQKMPGMTGVELLKRVYDLDPKTIRILVTAYGDAQTLGDAINSGAIYRFIPKPWQPDEMRLTLRRAVEAYALDRERDQLVRELTLLNRVARSITQQLDMDPLLDLLLDVVVGDLGYDGVSLLFFDAEEKVLSAGRFAPADSPVGESLRDLAIESEQVPEFVERLRDGQIQRLLAGEALGLNAPLRRWVTEVAAEEILVVPLMGPKGLIGVLAVDNRRGGAPFSVDDEMLLTGLAHQAVVAIENARLVQDLRRSREQVRRIDRLGTLGTLAAGLAHEINNPLVSIHTFLSMAPEKRAAEDPEFWGDYHALATREADRIRRLVSTMRTLGRETRGEVHREPFDPSIVMEEVLSLVQAEAESAGVELRVERESRVSKLVAVRDHVHQVLMNLALNGIQATRVGGTVTLRVGSDPSSEEICLEVVDTGGGIPEEHLPRIFDPFFTTKGPDRGTGLGLMICHRLVTDHGGSIEVQTGSAGSTFSVRLPADGRGRAPDAASLDQSLGDC